MGRVAAIESRIEAELLERRQEWMLGLYMEARCLYHALTADNDLPATPEEQKKKPSQAKILAAREWRMEHDGEWLEAISDPKAFGAFMGLPDLLGHPEKKKEKSRKEKAQEGYAAAHRALKNLWSGGNG